MNNVLAMILAGGQGKRMGNLCHIRPKPMLPFAGQFRVIDFSISNCIHSGINTIGILIDHQREIMSDYIRDWNRFNSNYGKLHALKPKVGLYKGTADAVYQNLKCIKDSGNEVVLLLAGDHVYWMDFNKMFEFYYEMGADVVIGVVAVPIEQVCRFGAASLDTENRITDFVEKPIVPGDNLVSMGIYIFKRKVLIDHLIGDSIQLSSFHDFGHTIIPEMVRHNKVFGYRFEGYWQDIGNIETYYTAHMELTRYPLSLRLNSHRPVLTGSNTPLDLKIVCNHNIEHSIISPDCIINGHVSNSVLSPHVVVEEDAVVKNSVIMANTIIGTQSKVDHCILDEDVHIGKFCHIGLRSHPIQKEKDIAVLEKGAVIPDYSTVYRPFSVQTNGTTLAYIVN